jgi:hypothetical protein
VNFEKQAFGQLTFAYKTIRSVALAFLREGEAIEFGENDNAKIGEGPAKSAGRFDTVQARHAEIQQGEMGLMTRRQLNGVHAVTGGGNHIKAPCKLQIVANGLKGGRGVVCDQDANWMFGRQAQLPKSI